jgi:hypothetical protein
MNTEKLNAIIQEIQEKYDKADREKLTASNRCAYAKQNETLSESKCRRQGFLSGLLVAKHIIEKYIKVEE